MEFIDLKKQQKHIRDSIDERLKKVLDEGRYIGGEEVQLFEDQLTLFCDSRHAIGCSNGTDALMLALMALDIGPGDGVITVPFTYIATLEAIAAVGATPVLVDVYNETFNMNPDHIEKVISESDKKIKAIMPVDLFGLPARYRIINDLAKKVLNVLNSDLEPIHVKPRPQEVKIAHCSASKARELLDYKTSVTLDQSIEKMANWIISMGPKKFRYHLDLEIVNENTPETWTTRLI